MATDTATGCELVDAYGGELIRQGAEAVGCTLLFFFLPFPLPPHNDIEIDVMYNSSAVNTADLTDFASVYIWVRVCMFDSPTLHPEAIQDQLSGSGRDHQGAV